MNTPSNPPPTPSACQSQRPFHPRIFHTLDGCLRLHGADPADAILAMGQVENSVITLGYNTLPNYKLDDVSEPGAAWCIEPCYHPNPVERPAQRCLEMYGQFQRIDGDQRTVRRPWMTRWDATSGNIDATELSAGPNGWVALCIHDGSPNGGMTGKHVLTATQKGVNVSGQLDVEGMPVLAVMDVNSEVLVARIGGKVVKLAIVP